MESRGNTKNKRSFFPFLFSSPEEKSAVLSGIIIAGIMSLTFLAIPRGTTTTATITPEGEVAASQQPSQEENDVIFSKYINDVEGCFSPATLPSNALVCQQRIIGGLDRYCNHNIESFDVEKCTVIRNDYRVFELLMTS
jgi:hypothetical protein